MGTDIHGCIQSRYSKDGKYYTDGRIERERNYLVFAILAGVRNGFGSAGCETFKPIVPIAEPRGLPPDLNLPYDWDAYNNKGERKHPELDFGEHSMSWVTLSELLKWPGWNEKLDDSGIVDRAQYEEMQQQGTNRPIDNYCSGVGGSSVVETTVEAIADGTAPKDWTHVRVRWSIPMREAVGTTFTKWMEYLEAKYSWLLEQDPAAVRLVFGFDS